jgi:hypothetical protein
MQARRNNVLPPWMTAWYNKLKLIN